MLKDDHARAGGTLIFAADVNGTEVRNRNREHVGTIDHLMIDKHTDKVAYAVMTFGGFRGLGDEEHTIPWKKLAYDSAAGGFVTDISPEQLQGAPERPDSWYADRQYETRAHDHYGVPYYWL